LPITYFAKRYGEFQTNEDDLDIYEGADFAIDSVVKFSLRRYRGYPKDTTTTIYLPDDLSKITDISKIISLILHELELPSKSIEWQRSDNPNL
jgi:hypothetical protein